MLLYEGAFSFSYSERGMGEWKLYMEGDSYPEKFLMSFIVLWLLGSEF